MSFRKWKSKEGIKINLLKGDCLQRLKRLRSNSVDSVVTDPPYEISFMGKKWDDAGTAHNIELWKEVLRVLKPGGHLVSFAATRTYHRMACAIEDAGFEIRDQLAWISSQGMPHGINISKAIDNTLGVKRTEYKGIKPGHEGFANKGNMSSVQSYKGTLGGKDGFARPWMDDPEKVEAYHHEFKPASLEAELYDGWNTALKPCWEPIVLARKPLSESTVAKNVLKWGTGGLNIDDTRILIKEKISGGPLHTAVAVPGASKNNPNKKLIERYKSSGRWPANITHDGSEEVVRLFPHSKSGSLSLAQQKKTERSNKIFGAMPKRVANTDYKANEGSAARFFYKSKASKYDRHGSKHPTVKPVSLMRWLTRLVTPPDGVVLDLFAGTGTTGLAAYLEGFDSILIERESEYLLDIAARFDHYLGAPPRVYNKNIDCNIPDNAVYIGRGSPWGNPYKISDRQDRDFVCDAFEDNVLPDLDVEKLRGKSLICFCHPKRCHGHSIMRKLYGVGWNQTRKPG